MIRRRAVRGLRRLTAAVLLCGFGLAGAGAPAVGAAPRPAASTASTLAVEITSVSTPSLAPDGRYTLQGTISNGGSGPVTGLAVRLSIDWALLDSDGIAAWAAQPDDAWAGTVWASTSLERPLPPGGTQSFSLTGTAQFLGLPADADAFGPRGLAVEVVGDAGDGVRRLAVQRTFVVWDPVPTAPPPAVRLSVLAPIVQPGGSPAEDDGAVRAQLVSDWSQTGRLTRVLRATSDPAIGWALDPSLLTAARSAQAAGTPAGTPEASPRITSVDPSGNATTAPRPTSDGGARASGSTPTPAPATPAEPTSQADRTATEATAWLESLVAGSSGRDVYSLPWGDLDLTAVAHANAVALVGAAQDAALAATRDVFGTPLDRSLSWPVEGLADAQTVSLLARYVDRTVVLSRSVLLPDQVPGRLALPGTRDDVSALVSDPQLGRAVADMGGGLSAQPVLGAQRAMALLAAQSREAQDAGLPADRVGVVAAIPRDWDPTRPEGVSAGLTLLRSARWIHVEHVSAAREQPAQAAPTAENWITYPDAARAAELPVEHVQALNAAYKRFLTMLTALHDPNPVFQSFRHRTLSLVSRTWRDGSGSGDDAGSAVGERLATARREVLGEVDQLFSGVSVVTGSAVNLLTRSGSLPVTVISTLPYALDLTLTLRPQSGRLVAEGPQSILLPAAEPGTTSRTNALVTVDARANGDVDVIVSLSAPGADRPFYTAADPIQVRVRHDWEDRALLIGGGLLGVLLLSGLVRSARRGRGSRIPPESVPDPDDVGRIPSTRASSRAGPATHEGAAEGTDGATAPATERATVADEGRRTGSTPPTSRARSLIRSSAVMSAGTLVSRILGLVRVVVLSAAIGAMASGDAFNTANTLPNTLFILIGGGALNAVLVPQIVRAAKQPDGGAEYVDRLLTLAILILGIATIVLTALAPILIRLYSKDWPEPKIALGTAFALWCLPQIFFYGLYTLYGQVLNARGSFGPYTWAPVVNNIVAIAGMGLFIAVAGRGVRPVEDWSGLDVTILAATTTLGVVAQALILVPVLNRTGYRWRPRWGWRGVGLRTAGSVAGWTFAGVVVAQLGFLVISRVVNGAGQNADVAGGRTVLDNAYLIFMLPHSLITVSVVTALFTPMSAAAAEGRRDLVRSDLSQAMRSVSVVTTFATVFFFVLGAYLINAMFVGTDPTTTLQYASAAVLMLLGLVPYSAQYLVQRVFYAFSDARTPFWVGALGTVLWTGGALWAPQLVEAGDVAATVGLALAVSTTITFAIWLPLVRRLLGGLDLRRILWTHLRLVVAAAAAGGIGVALRLTAPEVATAGRLDSMVVVAAIGIAMAVSYVVMLRLLRVQEVDVLFAMIRRRSPIGGAG